MGQGSSNEVPSYRGNIQIQYQTQRSAVAIQQALYENFVLPCWIKHDPRKGTQGYDSKKPDPLMDFYFQLIDEKIFNRQSASKPQILKIQQRQVGKQSIVKQQNVDELWKKLEKSIEASQRQWKIRMFKPKIQLDQKVTIFHLIKHKTPFRNLKFSQTDIVFLYTQKDGSFERCELNIEVNYRQNLPFTLQNAQKYWKNPDYNNIRLLKVEWQIKDTNKLFTRLPRIDPQNMLETIYYSINPVISRNQIKFPYQEPKLKKNKTFASKHFHLAFQGGGAKGLAYVGAYRAIKENSQNQKESIPITSIIGSSAGGTDVERQ